jgi:cyclophilin family peptidyl-prolyl cis-trans isomerase
MKKEIVNSIIIILLIPAIFLFGLFTKRENQKQNLSLEQTPTESNILGSSKTEETITVEPTKAEETNMEIDQKKQYTALLKTSAGEITLELNADKTPITVNNFVTLSRKNFYNNTIFHRVIKGFMIQGGDPKGDGTGGPGYKFNDEPFDGEYTKGTIAMANSGPNTNGSQFFIMHADYPLPKNYVIFGKVVKGIEVVDKIAEAEVVMSPMGENSRPVSPVKILSVEITEK